MKDIMLHPKIDDPDVTALGSMIVFISTEVCTQVRYFWLFVLRETFLLIVHVNIIWFKFILIVGGFLYLTIALLLYRRYCRYFKMPAIFPRC